MSATTAALPAGPAVPVGRWLDPNGGRALMTTGSALGALLLAACAAVTEPWQLYAIQVGIGAAAAASLYEAAFAVLVAALVSWGHRPASAATIAGLLGAVSVAGRLLFPA